MSLSKSDLGERLAEKAAELGFCAFGIARADAAPESGARLREWLADGAHGDMLWMAETAERRASPAGLWPEVKSVIALGMSYAPAGDPLALAERPELGRISVYAQGADYHDVVKKALKALARWLVEQSPGELKVFVDTAPVMEKPLAAAAGLGWQGKHTNLVSRRDGSWLFLGAIYTTLELEETAAAGHPAHCGSCTACLAACPTGAFPAPFRLDARRCISYLTIEHKGPIPLELREAIGNRIYGCDDCLAVCPWNRFADTARRNQAFVPRAELAAPALADLLDLDDAAFRQVFAGSPIKRIGRNRMVRNAAIAAGNSGRGELVPALERLAGDEDTVVAEAAAWAVARLASPSAGRGGGPGVHSGSATKGEAAMEDVRDAPVPAWFWAAAVVALLWEAMGCYQYLMQVRATDAALPAWVVAAFAVAVWVGLLGAVLLLMRRDWARMAFIVSLLAVLVQFGGLYMGGSMRPADAAMPALIVLVAAALAWFAHYSAKRGWLH